MIADNPGGAVRVEHVRLVTQPQHEPVMFHEADPQYGFLSELRAVARSQCEHGFTQRLDEAQLTSEIVNRKILVRQQF